ncbi:MAG TPA: energy transducer TonB [Allosphingosinicella sp.]|jgi:TonB family protein
MRAALLLSLLALPAAAGAAPAKLGEMIEVAGETLLPQLDLRLDLPEGPEAGVMRRIALDWQDKPIQVGTYPAAAFAARREGHVGIRLTIEPDGRLSACEVTKPSGGADLDAHACKHLLAHARFHPGLDDEGRRVGGTVAAELGYQLRMLMNTLTGQPSATPPPHTPAVPLEPVTAETLGITRATRLPNWTGGISAAVLVRADGSVGACTLHSPTYLDAVDTAACRALRERVRFRPARDAQGQAVESAHVVSISFGR